MGQVQKSESPNVDPFSLAEAVLEKDREITKPKEQVFTKNPILKWGVESNGKSTKNWYNG